MNLSEHAASVEKYLPSSRFLRSDVQNLSPKIVENLRELVYVLKHVPDSVFSMEDFNSNCGTICCAAGWAAQFDIGNTGNKYEYCFPWSDEKCFNWGKYTSVELCGGSEAIFEYLFDGGWVVYENTVEQAIQRIERVLNEFNRTR